MDTNTSIHQVIAALLDLETIFPPKLLYALSDLDPDDLRVLREVWKTIPLVRRQALLEDLTELASHDNLLIFEEVGKIGLKDEEDSVIVRAIDLLFDSEDGRLPAKYISLLTLEKHDELVRAAAANALGPYVYFGELEDIPSDLLTRIDAALLVATRKDPSDLVRRRALEALGYSSNPVVPALIRQAAAREDIQWLESALFAMGRSADEIWKPDVLENLTHEELSVQMQAIHAAGELGLSEARPILAKLLKQPHQDSELRKEAIWALGEIGGDISIELLEALLEKAEDDEEYTLIEEAIDKANLGTDTGLQDLLRIDLDEAKLPEHADHDHDEDESDEDDGEFKEEWSRYVDEDDDSDYEDDEDEDSYDFEDPLEFGDEDDGF
ncbi:MAG: HEAT repeat domain-containing protein [Anaerolineaceae bacterium]